MEVPFLQGYFQEFLACISLIMVPFHGFYALEINNLFTETSVPQTILVYDLVIAFGILHGRVKIFRISLGVPGYFSWDYFSLTPGWRSIRKQNISYRNSG